MQNKKDEIITKDTEATVSANEGSVKDQGKEKQMSTEEFKEKYMKQIPLEELPADFRSKFEFVTQELKDLKEEAGTKRKDFLTKSDLLNKKLSLLVKEGKLSLDQNEFKKTQEVVKNYDNLLNNLITEVENELRFTQGLISGDHPKHVDVLKWESDDVSVFLDTKLKWLKKYIKNVRKDLRLSYSKYNFSFESQIKKLDYLSAYLKHVTANSKK